MPKDNIIKWEESEYSVVLKAVAESLNQKDVERYELLIENLLELEKSPTLIPMKNILIFTIQQKACPNSATKKNCV